ncbi:hypothetical protein HMPREF0290_2078 [Corynebacterium efficiens YS-314]|uniref:Uncharacterized protein n=1 Tax=Corynebacterium efficiens (strain DSM 44549 / YS-314 / AJ 12310 / JCM 11189 / NBRC 100395) TaxID=196164 RepID=Q8FNU9_COREF|nr:hypothetical protein [Corynebacterium efficiens]EEW49259.1 hypothetical protein HMPREF0290_2078 [Corynebacterium efficiens YS-314]BAC18854.1 hypothetical protein [Corynebacterium efficiens YS-314]
MFIAALVLSALGFVLLVVTITTPSEIWTWLLIITVVAGLVCFLIAESSARRQRGRAHPSELGDSTQAQHGDAR